MKNIAFLISALLTVACGSQRYIDPEVSDYVDEVMGACEYDNCQLIESVEYIGFGDAKGYYGYCDVQVSEIRDIKLPITRNVYIDRANWEQFNENQRLSLIAHELGHCNWKQDDQKNSLSLMDPEKHYQLNPDDPMQTFLDYYALNLEGKHEIR